MFLLSFLLFVVGMDGYVHPTTENAQNGLFETVEYTVPSKTSSFYRDSVLVSASDLDPISYQKVKLEASLLRLSLESKLKRGSISMDGVKLQFTNYLVDKLIPYWYGTPWSFGGHTAVPGQGKIACGYFISTTLRDMGIKLNRYKLAQKAPIDEAKFIGCGNDVLSVEAKDSTEAFQKIDAMTQDGLYFIGFDEGHVGYLLKRDGKLSLIHSNYLYPISVCRESLKDSRVFQSFSKFHLVDISHNDKLMRRWLSNSVVP